MKLKIKFSIVLFIVFGFLIVSCDKNDASESTSHIQFLLVDAPGDYKEVNIDIIDLQVNSLVDEEGWISLDNVNTGVYDLIELTGGSSALLFEDDLPAGYMNQIRIILGNQNSVKLMDDDENDENDVEISLNTPSAQQSGLKLNLHTELIAGVDYTFIFDWDADKSIVKAGNSGTYNLKPVIRVATEANSGAVNGRVADMEETEENADPLPLGGAIVTLFSGDTEIASATANDLGLFVIHGVAPGTYKAKLALSGYEDSEFTADFDVVLGVSTDLGTLFLTKSNS